MVFLSNISAGVSLSLESIVPQLLRAHIQHWNVAVLPTGNKKLLNLKRDLRLHVRIRDSEMGVWFGVVKEPAVDISVDSSFMHRYVLSMYRPYVE